MLSPASIREYLATETPPIFVQNAVRSLLYRSGSTGGSSSASSTCTTDPSIEVGEIAELPPSTDIMKTMECPVCKDIAFPPIWNCSSGHSICNTCRQQLANCALCKANFTEARNYSLESLVLSSKFNCHYKSKGCGELIKGENYRDHLRNCKSRPGAGQGCHRILPSGYNYRNRPPSSGAGEDDPLADLESQFSELDIEDDFEVVSWVKCQNGRYPENAIVAGYCFGEPVLISRAYQGSRLTMGRLIPSEKAAFVYWQTCRKKWYYEVLVAIPQTVKWVDASWGDVPLGAISGGYSPDMENIFIGRACKDERYIPGFVQPSRQGCFIGIGQQIHLSHDYQVLVRDV